MLGLDSERALLLVPAGQRYVQHVKVRGFLHYITHTKMEASYKMVILPLLLQSPEGRLTMPELGLGFRRFYDLLMLGGLTPERPGIGMSKVQGMRPSRVLEILKGAPKVALSGSGMVAYPGDAVEISREVWAYMTAADRDRAREAAVDRLTGYYREALGYTADFSSLLYGAGGPPAGANLH